MPLTPSVDTYATEAQLAAYAAARGITVTGTPAVILTRAMDYLATLEDRWQGIEENIDHAIATARLFDLSVVGCYASCEAFATVDNYPPPPIIIKANLSLRVLYQTCCCPGHPWVSILAKDKRLIRGENFQISPGKRSDKYINQKRILKAWSQFHGTIDYSNRPTFSEVSSAILANAD
jgi:hypothetical protein